MKRVLVVVASVLALCSCSRSTSDLAADATAQASAAGSIMPSSAADPAAQTATADQASPASEGGDDLATVHAKVDEDNAKISQLISQQQAAAGAGPTIDPKFGARPPRACPDITTVPTSAQAAVLIQCTMDYQTAQQAKLHQDIVVQVGASRAAGNMDQWPSIDPRSPVADLNGSATAYLCGPVLEAVMHNAGSNCDRYQYQNAPGICWKTLPGNYKCQFTGPMTGVVRNQAPPTTY
jgi:hypothetical protein